MRRRFVFALALVATVGPGSGGLAQDAAPIRQSLTKSGFRLPAEKPVKILLIRSDIKVVEQTAAGLRQPSADLTLLARENLKTALAGWLKRQKIALIELPQTEAADSAFIADYQSLLTAVVGTVIKHRLLSTDLLPTKNSQLNWSLGNSGARLAYSTGADYALFMNMYDTFDAPGRQTATNVAGIMGRAVSAGLHTGYAGLVDLRTGDLVWISMNLQMKGDVRRSGGADRRITQLFDTSPLQGGGNSTGKPDRE